MEEGEKSFGWVWSLGRGREVVRVGVIPLEEEEESLGWVWSIRTGRGSH
jgi:hypothetical protein